MADKPSTRITPAENSSPLSPTVNLKPTDLPDNGEKDPNGSSERITPENLTPNKPEKSKSQEKREAVQNAKPTQIEKAIQAGVDIKSLIAEIKQQVTDELQKEVASGAVAVPTVSTVTENDKAKWLSKAERTKIWVWAQEQIRYIVPLEPREKKGKAFFSWIRNGYRLNIPKGIPIMLPEPVVADIEESMNLTQEAYDNKYNLENVTAEVLEALAE